MSNQDKGFGSMDEAKQKDIASQGGKTPAGHGHNSEHDKHKENKDNHADHAHENEYNKNKDSK